MVKREEPYTRSSAYIESSGHDVRHIGRTPEEMGEEVVQEELILVRDDQMHQGCKDLFRAQTGL